MARQVSQSTKKDVPNSLVVGGSLTVLGGINNPDFAKTITRLATTQEEVRQVSTAIEGIIDEPFGPAIRSSAPAIVIKADGTVAPEEITFQGIVKPLGGTPFFYLGIFKIYKDGDLYYTTPTAVTSLTWTVDIVQSLTPGEEVYPSINLYPSFSNRLITIELYDETGTDLLDTLNISILPSWESYIQNELAGYTPKYIGKFNGAHSGSYHEGDWWLVYDADDTPITRGVYRSINFTPTRVDGANAANSQFIVAALPDILWASNNSYGDLDDYAPITYISNLVANAAFISNLFAQYIKIQTGGSIRGGDRYDEDGAVIDGTKPGFYIGASGACKVAGIEFEGSQGGGVQWGNAIPVGSQAQVSNNPALSITKMSYNRIAVATIGKLEMYPYASGFSGSGNYLSITLTKPAICGMDMDHVALIDENNDSLRMYHYDGGSYPTPGFSLVGSGLSLVVSNPAICAISSTDVVLYGNSGNISTYRFNGSSWSKISNDLSIGVYSNIKITAIGADRFTVYNGNTGTLSMYKISGSNISLDGSALTGLNTGTIPICSINGTDVISVDYANSIIKLYRWNGSAFNEVEEGNSGIVKSGTPIVCAINGNTFAIGYTSTYHYVQAYSLNFSVSVPWIPPYNQ